MPLKIAAKVDGKDRDYFEREIKHLFDDPLVDYVGEIGEAEKNAFLGGAAALLFPIDWPEPFGLVMIEAMACGTPVVAFRCGSVPEVMRNGVSGYVVDTIDEAVAATARAVELPRARRARLLRRAVLGAAHGGGLRRDLRGADRGRAAAAAGAVGPRSGWRRSTAKAATRTARTRSTGWRRRSGCRDGLTSMPTFGTTADDEVVSLHEQYYIQATSSRADDRTRVLKHDETFAVFDRFGDVQPVGLGEQGVYHDGTRFLSRLELRIGGRRPLMLSSTVKKENDLLTVDLATPDLKDPKGEIVLPRGTLHVFRTKFLWRSCCYERLRISNFATTAVDVELALSFNADYADIFEVRGTKRERRGTRLRAGRRARAGVTLGYEGLDRVVRRTRLAFDPAPDDLTGGAGAASTCGCRSRGTSTIYVKLSCDGGGGECAELDYDRACAALGGVGRGQPAVALPRARARLGAGRMGRPFGLRPGDDAHARRRTGPIPYAGVPWFSTPFGRDGIITALEVLWLAPDIARGVLALSGRDAGDRDVARARRRAGQDPARGARRRDGGAGRGAVRTLLRQRRRDAAVRDAGGGVLPAHRRPGVPALDLRRRSQRALDWIERYGDVDGDGFVEYARQTPTRAGAAGLEGLARLGLSRRTAGWPRRRSRCARCRRTCTAAWQAAAEIAAALGVSDDGARRALATAQGGGDARRASRRRSGTRSWAPTCWRSTGEKRPCRVASSNAGHALWTGIIADPARARRVADGLMGDESFSGWGIRTIPSSQVRYNPMAYHNGSVWPHDNAIIAAGFSRYGFRDLVVRLLEGMKDASVAVEMRRLPELICGFPRRPGEGPTQYPVACAPQAWAAGSVFMLLSAALGLSVDGCNDAGHAVASGVARERPDVAADRPARRRRQRRSR